MTLPDEKLRAIYALDQALLELAIKPWPSATQGRALLRRALRHYPGPREIASALFPRGSNEAIRAGCLCDSDRLDETCPIHGRIVLRR
jgi:hypothetical protein